MTREMQADVIEGVSIRDLEKTMHFACSERDVARLARKDIKAQLGALQGELKVEWTRNRELFTTLCCFLETKIAP